MTFRFHIKRRYCDLDPNTDIATSSSCLPIFYTKMKVTKQSHMSISFIVDREVLLDKLDTSMTDRHILSSSTSLRKAEQERRGLYTKDSATSSSNRKEFIRQMDRRKYSHSFPTLHLLTFINCETTRKSRVAEVYKQASIRSLILISSC